MCCLLTRHVFTCTRAVRLHIYSLWSELAPMGIPWAYRCCVTFSCVCFFFLKFRLANMAWTQSFWGVLAASSRCAQTLNLSQQQPAEPVWLNLAFVLYNVYLTDEKREPPIRCGWTLIWSSNRRENVYVREGICSCWHLAVHHVRNDTTCDKGHGRKAVKRERTWARPKSKPPNRVQQLLACIMLTW